MKCTFKTYEWATRYGFVVTGPLGTELHDSGPEYVNAKSAHEAGLRYLREQCK